MIFLPTTLYRVLLPILLFTWGVSTHGQIVINEICASNQTVGMDEDGNFPDWFELYNAGSSGVQLGNYKVSDLSTLPAKFALPNQLLNPGEHLRIWASEKNRKSSVHHWETALFESDTWNYFLPTSNIPGWTGLSFDDSGWPSGKGGFGFGDNDDSTLVPTTQLSVYIRKTFTITDLSSISNMVLHLDYDDGFAVWINGTLAARSNLSANPAFNEPASNSNEAVMYNNQAPPYFSLDTGLLVAGNNVICIEVHNNNINSSDLSCRPFLSFGISNANTFWNNPPSWFSIPTQLPIHTNFKLSAGETLSLYDASGTLLDSKLIPTDLRSDQSMGRSPSGGGTWKFFTQPTPGTTNTGNSFDSYCQNTIIFSQPAGFYSGSIQVSLSGSSVIRYTLDGSEPSASSPLYTAPITISSTKVLKAICAATGTYPMRTFVNTYFINVSTSLPVWSISTAPANFFDFNTGIYEMGPNAGTESPYFGANFWEDWERPVFVEFFEKDKTRRVAQGADIRIYGNYSRGNDMKSLLLMAKNKYGSDRFQYKFHFQKPVTSFEDIVLRNSGGDFNITHFRDGFIQAEIARVSSLDYQAYRPSVVFINGAYWGIHNIREKIGADFISENHGIKKSEVDLAETWGDSISGTNNIYYLHAYSKALDMTNSLQYKFVADSFDIPNMIDYFASQIYISNWDWPQNNVKFWRQNNGDRKFRYILWDTDLSLGIFNLQDYNY
nr:CotH kinase family protein [Cytophagaceae bacterium]